LSAFLPILSSTMYAPSGRLVARPCFASRLHTTGHFLHRGRDLQQRFFGLTRFTVGQRSNAIREP
jgi:hypothetical protein